MILIQAAQVPQLRGRGYHLSFFKQATHWPGLEVPVIFQQGAISHTGKWLLVCLPACLPACLQAAAAAAAACAINDDNMLRHTRRLFLRNLVLEGEKKKLPRNYGIMVKRERGKNGDVLDCSSLPFYQNIMEALWQLGVEPIHCPNLLGPRTSHSKSGR